MNSERKLPVHVREYLESRDVDPSELPENVFQALSGLSTREVQFLEFIGAELREGGLDHSIVAAIH